MEYAVRKTNKGFTLCTVETIRTNYGGIRRFSKDFNLTYKREAFAIKKAHNFFKELHKHYTGPAPIFRGVIGPDDYKGEPA